MVAKFGTVPLPYGIQEVNPGQQGIVPVIRIPLGKPVYQDLGLGEEGMDLNFTVPFAFAREIEELYEGTRLFHVDPNDGYPFGMIVNNVGYRRAGKFPNCITVNVTGYKLDGDVLNIKYDLLEDFSIAPSGATVTPETDEEIDDYATWVVVESSGNATAWVQTSSDKITWTTHPDDLGWEVNNKRRIISLNHLTGYARVVMKNDDTVNINTNVRMYLAKEIL